MKHALCTACRPLEDPATPHCICGLNWPCQLLAREEA